MEKTNSLSPIKRKVKCIGIHDAISSIRPMFMNKQQFLEKNRNYIVAQGYPRSSVM